jgi:hypothetical protein
VGQIQDNFSFEVKRTTKISSVYLDLMLIDSIFILGQNNSLPFNKYAFLTTHNAFSIEGEPSHTGVPRITEINQEDNITQQLNVCYLILT